VKCPGIIRVFYPIGNKEERFMSNKQRHWLLVIATVVFGAVAVASIAYAQFNPQPDPPARIKKKTNDNDTKSAVDSFRGGDKTGNKGFIWFNQGTNTPGADKSMGGDVRGLKQSPQVK
jgi:hypothetical protein